MAESTVRKVASRLPQPKSFVRTTQVPNAMPLRASRRSQSVSDLSSATAKTNSVFKRPANPAPGLQRSNSVAANRKRPASDGVNGPPTAKLTRTALSTRTAPSTRTALSTKTDLNKAKPGPDKNPAEKGKMPNSSRVKPWDIKGQRDLALEKVKKLQNEKENLKAVEAAAADLQTQLNLKSKALQSCEAELDSLRKKLLEAEQAYTLCKDLQTEKKDLEATIVNLEEARSNLVSDLQNSEAKLKEAFLTIKDLTLDLETTRLSYQNASQSLANSREENQEQQKMIFDLRQQMKEMLNDIMDLKGNIRIMCRIRPPTNTEGTRALSDITILDETTLEIKSLTASSGPTPKYRAERFCLNRVFPMSATQQDVYEELSQLIQSALNGYNVCIFAYGQTGSGKTFTMEGDRTKKDIAGIIPRAVETLFQTVAELKKVGWEFVLKISFVEIYNEVIKDLLNRNSSLSHDIKMVEGNPDDVYVSNLKVETVSTAEEVFDLLNIAQQNRSVASTICNDYSSRSHSIMQVKIMGTNSSRGAESQGNLNLIDLAGSEKYNFLNKSNRQVETININKSLSSLSTVVHKLVEKADHIPFRDSKLTYLLMPSLKGNSKTLMLVNVSPFDDCINETLNSLRFAKRVAQVKTESKRQVKSNQM